MFALPSSTEPLLRQPGAEVGTAAHTGHGEGDPITALHSVGPTGPGAPARPHGAPGSPPREPEGPVRGVGQHAPAPRSLGFSALPAGVAPAHPPPTCEVTAATASEKHRTRHKHQVASLCDLSVGGGKKNYQCPTNKSLRMNLREVQLRKRRNAAELS